MTIYKIWVQFLVQKIGSKNSRQKIWVQFGASKKDDIQNLWLMFFGAKIGSKNDKFVAIF